MHREGKKRRGRSGRGEDTCRKMPNVPGHGDAENCLRAKQEGTERYIRHIAKNICGALVWSEAPRSEQKGAMSSLDGVAAGTYPSYSSRIRKGANRRKTPMKPTYQDLDNLRELEGGRGRRCSWRKRAANGCSMAEEAAFPP